LTKAELVRRIATETGLSRKDALEAIEATFAAISGALASGDKVTLVGFGTFAVKKRKPRLGRNPRTKKEIKIAARSVPAFKAGKALRDKVAK
jgi:integration host factor beta subunit